MVMVSVRAKTFYQKARQAIQNDVDDIVKVDDEVEWVNPPNSNLSRRNWVGRRCKVIEVKWQYGHIPSYHGYPTGEDNEINIYVRVLVRLRHRPGFIASCDKYHPQLMEFKRFFKRVEDCDD